MRRLRIRFAAWLLRKELAAEVDRCAAEVDHQAKRGRSGFPRERYWMGRLTAADRIRKGRFN